MVIAMTFTFLEDVKTNLQKHTRATKIRSKMLTQRKLPFLLKAKEQFCISIKKKTNQNNASKECGEMITELSAKKN